MLTVDEALSLQEPWDNCGANWIMTSEDRGLCEQSTVGL